MNTEVKMSVYYRTADERKLRRIDTWAETTEESVKDVFQAVMKQLHAEMEVFHKPVLTLIQGGKA